VMARCPDTASLVFVRFDQENYMDGSDKKGKVLHEDERKSKKMPSKPAEDDHEDGDIATPKRDRYGEDDEPL